MIRLDTAERRRRLQVRHLLAGASAADPGPVAQALVALHATDPATLHLSVAARTAGGGPQDLADALYLDRRLVRVMAMRRTMFLVTAELAPVVQAACSVAVAAAQRRHLLTQLRTAGVADDASRWLDEVCHSTLAAIQRRGSAVATDLVADEPRLEVTLDPAPGKSYGGPRKLTSRILTLLALQGHIVRGEVLGGWTGSRNQWWPAAAWLPGGLGTLDPGPARVELARRWLASFGPALMADLTWWTGWTGAQTTAAVQALAIVEVDLGGETGLVLAADLDSTAEPEPTAALLPALDPTPMGWAERGWYLGEHRSRLFDRTGNIGPTVFWQGRVVGGWAQRADGEIRTQLLEDIGADGQRAVHRRVDQLTGWLGPLRVTPRFRTPLERELSS